jgi:carboxymethylenebutenolidase
VSNRKRLAKIAQACPSTGMKALLVTAFALLLSSAALAQTAHSSAPLITPPKIVEVRSGAVRLKAYFWLPLGPGPFPAVLFNHGSGAADAQHTAGQTMAEAAARLAPLFLKHGYAFFYLCRRGQGLSADQAPFMQDVLQREESAKGKDAQQHLHYILVTTDQLEDSLAGLDFLKIASGIDPTRIAIVGHSFGGVITLLSGERDAAIRAEVTFGAGANAWKLSQELRQRVLAAVGKTTAPIMLIHAANDYDTTPGTPSLLNLSVFTNLMSSRFTLRLVNPRTTATTSCTLPSPHGSLTSSNSSMRTSDADPRRQPSLDSQTLCFF